MDRKHDVLRALRRDERTREEIAQSLGPNTLRDVRQAVASLCGLGLVTQTGERDHDRLLRLTDAGRERLENLERAAAKADANTNTNATKGAA